ncbi:hypothetical protein ABW20_dc0108363 [Dactylellina cionopaga]|nr:hypothetical protein ABW20_dc0108363 [Dactylellina cionopaga]
MAPVSYTYEYKASESTTTPQGTSSRSVHTNPQGTTVTNTQQPAGGQTNTQTEYYPAGGNSNQGRIEGESQGGSSGGTSQEEADRRYLEAMEDEYAKREGGA